LRLLTALEDLLEGGDFLRILRNHLEINAVLAAGPLVVAHLGVAYAQAPVGDGQLLVGSQGFSEQTNGFLEALLADEGVALLVVFQGQLGRPLARLALGDVLLPSLSLLLLGRFFLLLFLLGYFLPGIRGFFRLTVGGLGFSGVGRTSLPRAVRTA
jgi:hypothetical protein